MTHKEKGHYRQKHAPDRNPNPELANVLKKESSEKGVTCAAAHGVAESMSQSPAEVGFTMDFLEMPILKCQLGLFGYSPEKKIVKPAQTVTQTIEDAIRQRLVRGRLSCKDAWEIADTLGEKRMVVSAACEALHIKITPCQLGAF
jgi:hypothetical protein